MWYATDAQKMQGVEVGVDMGLEVWSWNGFWGECGWLLLLLGAAAADDSDDDFGGCHNKVAGAAASHKGRGSSCVAWTSLGSEQHEAWLLLRPPPEMIL